ncbi:MAG: CopG family transcriptional regulator [Candidatus Bathyarchaeota archaeon]|nr:CopG family transcriptional regulator [Candidatus Bathyarchaeota archaeon]
MSKEKTVQVSISKELYEKIQEFIEGTIYTSVDEYVEDKLMEDFPFKEVFSEEEEKIIKERLKRLGYIE